MCDNEFYENGCWLIRRTSKRQGIMAVALETAVGGIRLGVQLNRRAENAQFPYSASSSLFFQARNLSSHSLVHDALCISSRARSAGEGAARLSIRSRAGSIRCDLPPSNFFYFPARANRSDIELCCSIMRAEYN